MFKIFKKFLICFIALISFIGCNSNSNNKNLSKKITLLKFKPSLKISKYLELPQNSFLPEWSDKEPGKIFFSNIDNKGSNTINYYNIETKESKFISKGISSYVLTKGKLIFTYGNLYEINLTNKKIKEIGKFDKSLVDIADQGKNNDLLLEIDKKNKEDNLNPYIIYDYSKAIVKRFKTPYGYYIFDVMWGNKPSVVYYGARFGSLKEGNLSIWKTNIDTNQIEKILVLGSYFEPSISPNEKYLAVVQYEGMLKIIEIKNRTVVFKKYFKEKTITDIKWLKKDFIYLQIEDWKKNYTNSVIYKISKGL